MKKDINNNYWNNFYKKKHINKPTLFAKFCLSKLRNYNKTIFDIGCGNGRDTVFFNNKSINSIGIDKSYSAIKKNKKNFQKFRNKFINKNFCSFFTYKNFDFPFSVYSRFTLHSINYSDEKKLLNSLNKQKKLEYIFIECRTIKDDIYGKGKKVGKHEFVDTHYRRFIDPKEIKRRLSKHFKISYFKESKNFAKFKKENPCILRLIAKKK